MCVEAASFGGGQMAQRLLLEHGIDPNKDCAKYLEGEKQDNVVLAVKAGVVDAGTVRSDQLEMMAAEKKIKMAEFRVLSPVQDDFPFVHSTQLYPEWPVAACAKTATEVSESVAAALRKLDAAHPAAKAAKVAGWAEPLDYSPVVECLEAIKYGVFAN
jgi:ABC-type phosphate/phosphonate transport system substrate-binding protein